MHNLGTVIAFEVVRTLKKPTFWISVISIPVLLGVLFAIIFFSSKSSEEAQLALEREGFSLLVLDESTVIQDSALEQLQAKRTTSKQAAIDAVSNATVDAFFYYPSDFTTHSIEVYNKNDGLIGNERYTKTAQALLTISASESLSSPKLLPAIKGETPTTQTTFQDGESVNLIGKMAAPALFLILFYIVIVLLANQMLASTTEEKENRVTEMLLTSLSSRTLIVGKIIALVLLGFIQIATLLLPVLLGYLLGRQALDIPDITNIISVIQFEFWPTVIGAGLLVSGFLLFTGLLVGIGAATPTAKEANSFFGVVILLMFIPFYFLSLLMSESNSWVVTGLSYFPLTAPITLMIRNVFGTLSPTEGLVGLGIVTLFGMLAIHLAIRIFRYGTLEYAKRLSFSNVFRSTK